MDGRAFSARIARQAPRYKLCEGSYILYSPSGSCGNGKYVTGTLNSVCSPFIDYIELTGYSAAAVNCLLRALVLDRYLFFPRTPNDNTEKSHGMWHGITKAVL